MAGGDRQFEQARTALSAVCTAAVEAGHLTDHPVRQRPGTRRRRRHVPVGSPRLGSTVAVLSVDELFGLANAMPSPYGLAALLTTFAGLRGGETFALAHRHLVRDETGRIAGVVVERALIELPGQPITFGPPKTGAGARRVALPEQVGDLLAAYVAGSDASPDRLLFTTATGRPVGRARRADIMARARLRSGVGAVRWHDLRHAGLTLAAAVPGVTVRNLMDRGGHSTARAALIYQHSALDADGLLAAGLGRLIADARSRNKPS